MSTIKWRTYGDTSIQTVIPQEGEIIVYKPSSGTPKVCIGDGDTYGGHRLAMENSVSGSFTSTDGKTVTIVNGQITNIT